MKREIWLTVLRQRDREMDEMKEMKEMKEMNEAFDRFHEACTKALDAIEDFHKLDINERQVDMNGDVYIREDEDYLDRD